MPDVAPQFGSNVIYVDFLDDGTCRLEIEGSGSVPPRCPFVTKHKGAQLIYCKRFRVQLGPFLPPDVNLRIFERCEKCKKGLKKLEVLAKVQRPPKGG